MLLAASLAWDSLVTTSLCLGTIETCYRRFPRHGRDTSSRGIARDFGLVVRRDMSVEKVPVRCTVSRRPPGGQRNILYKYSPAVEVEVAVVTGVWLDVGIWSSCQWNAAESLNVDAASRVGMCLSRCSLRVNCLPQWEHHTFFVDGVSDGIAPARFDIRPRLSTSDGPGARAGGRVSAVRRGVRLS